MDTQIRYDTFVFIFVVVVCYLLCQLCLGFKGCLEISCKKTSDKPPTSLSKFLFILWFNFVKPVILFSIQLLLLALFIYLFFWYFKGLGFTQHNGSSL